MERNYQGRCAICGFADIASVYEAEESDAEITARKKLEVRHHALNFSGKECFEDDLVVLLYKYPEDDEDNGYEEQY